MKGESEVALRAGIAINFLGRVGCDDGPAIPVSAAYAGGGTALVARVVLSPAVGSRAVVCSVSSMGVCPVAEKASDDFISAIMFVGTLNHEMY